MLPTSNQPARILARKAPAAKAKGPRLRRESRDALEPIGPERLRALREAIRNGTYPTEADVLGGLERMLEGD